MTEMNPVGVDTAGLLAAGATVIAGADEARRSFEGHTTALTAAAGGLFGNSSRALQTKASAWSAVGATLSQSAGEHGTTMQSAAWNYDTTDDDSSHVVQTAIHRPTTSTSPSTLRL